MPDDEVYTRPLPKPNRANSKTKQKLQNSNLPDNLHASAPPKPKKVEDPFDIFGPSPASNSNPNEPSSHQTHSIHKLAHTASESDFGSPASIASAPAKPKSVNPFDDSDDDDDWHTAHSYFSMGPSEGNAMLNQKKIGHHVPKLPASKPLPQAPSRSQINSPQAKLVSTSDFPERGRSKVVASSLTASAPASSTPHSKSDSQHFMLSNSIQYADIPIKQGQCCREECGVIVIFLPMTDVETTTVRCYVCNTLNSFSDANSSIVTKERANEMEVEGTSNFFFFFLIDMANHHHDSFKKLGPFHI